MDLRFAVRSLLKTPGFTALAVVVMALGIGANTAVFSVVNAVLLKPLDYKNPERIVTLRNHWTRDGHNSNFISGPDYHDWHDQSNAFEAMAYYAGWPTAVSNGQVTEYTDIAEVTPEFFRVFGAEPFIGRLFSEEEQKKGSAGAALISEGYWRSHFGGSPDILGKTVRVLDKPLTIVGVLAPGFHFPKTTDVWFPANTIQQENPNRSAHNYFVVGRLKGGVSVEQAQAQMVSIASRLSQLYPQSNTGKSVIVMRLRDTMTNNIKLTLWVLLGAVAAILLIACANIANLLLAKSTTRSREIAIRAAVGASRARIVRQLMVESLVLAFASGLLALIIAAWGSKSLVLLAPKNVPRLGETQVDAWVLAFTFGISTLACLLFGLLPALQTSKVDLNDALKRGGRALGGSAGRLRGALVVTEVALSVILLAGAGLLIRSFQALMNVALGYRTEKILVANTNVQSSSNEESLKHAVPFDNDFGGRLRAMPGVIAVGAAAALPGSPGSDGGYWIDHLPPREQMGVNSPQAVFSVIGPGTLDTLGIPLTRGRDLSEKDVYAAPFVVVINEALARKSFPGQDPIGRQIFCGLDSMNPMTIVGVAGDVRQWGPSSPPSPELYMPYQQHPGWANDLNFVIRTATEPTTLSEAVRRDIREHAPDVPVKFTTMEAKFAESVAAPRFQALLTGIFAALAISLAMAGVYGVLAYIVSQRTSEIGIRMALGASASDVTRLFLGQGLALAAIGLTIGLAGAFAATRLLSSILFEVKPGDPLTYLLVTGLLCVVALAASFIPARRAAHVDPLVALRQE